jgi:hypothetical protein
VRTITPEEQEVATLDVVTGTKAPATPTVFLGGETKTDWRSDIIDEFKDTLNLIDPVDPEWDPAVNIYQELTQALESDDVVFYKGGDGTAGEKQVLDAAGVDYQEFDDLEELSDALEKLATIKTGAYDQGCLLVAVPEDLRRHLLKELAPQISEDQLCKDKEETTNGIESESHCTLLFGTKPGVETTAAIRKFFTRPLVIKSGTTLGYFDNEETACYIPVESEDLNKLHYALRDALPNKQREGEYKPHITLAYLKKGERLPDLKAQPFEWQVNSILVSNPDGSKEEIYIEGMEPEHQAVEVLSTVDDEWFDVIDHAASRLSKPLDLRAGRG